MKHIFLIAAIAGCSALYAGTPELVTVGDPGNPGKILPYHTTNKPYPRGTVNYPYRIGTSEVSNAEYAEFLNACAAKEDPHLLWDQRMKITRQGSPGNYRYTAENGGERKAVAFVSRVNAARYCNYLTGGSPEQGAYRIGKKLRTNGKTADAIIEYRDLTFPDAARVYYLPDMHEFFKAGWYDGKGSYRELTEDSRNQPSGYGISGHASGLREHMENKVHAGVPFVLGAADSDHGANALNTAQLWPQAEYEGGEHSGFRVAATAPLQIGDRLNRRNNFFFDRKEPAVLRIRHDGPAQRADFTLELQDFTGKTVWKKLLSPELRPGVNPFPLALPEADGYYELRVTPADRSFNSHAAVIPLAVMYEDADNGATGRFGLTSHILRRERIFNFSEFDFDLLRRLGVSTVRVDVSFGDRDGSLAVLKRTHEAGLEPLAILPGVYSYATLEEKRAAHPELAEKWAKHGVAPDFAYYAEQVFQLVSEYKQYVSNWEIGNEPTFWRLLTEDYAQLLKSSRIAAKLADPDCNVMAGDLSAIHPAFFSIRGGDFSDSLAIHIYGFYVPKFWGLAGKMRELNGWKKAAGVAEKPIWITETGASTYSSIHTIPVRTLDEVRRYQAVHMPKIMAGGVALGATKVQPYNFRDVPVDCLEEEFGMVDRYGLPKPAAAAYRTTARLLGRADFRAFLAGHSFGPGRIVGLAFRDREERDVLVFWRNDLYSHDQFNIPFADLIKPPETVTVKAAPGQVECYNLSGGKSILPVENGAVRIPVDEYPVFVRGKLFPETADVSVAHEIPAIRFPKAEVRILPNRPARSCDLQATKTLRMVSGARETVTVHVYNLKNEPLSGTLRLKPKNRWNEWAWPVSPASLPLTIPGNGMGEGIFQLSVPQEKNGDFLFYLDAVFDTDDEAAFRDTVAFRISPRTFDGNEWITYSKGYRLAQENSEEIRISWQPERDSSAGFTAKTGRPFAGNSAELDCDVVLPVKPAGTKINAVNLLFRDATGDIYQLKQNINLPPDEWHEVRFHAGDILRKGVILHKGGDGKVDYPVKLHGFIFDLRRDETAETGSILLKTPEKTETKPLWTAGKWTVNGNGYQLSLKPDGSEAIISRTPESRYFVSLVSTPRPVFATDAASWPAAVELSFLPKTVGVYSVSFLVEDATGENFQLKRNLPARTDVLQTVSFNPVDFSGKEFGAWGGNKDRKLDYPVKLLGFNFEFTKSNQPSELVVYPPTFGKTGERLSGGGGSVGLD